MLNCPNCSKELHNFHPKLKSIECKNCNSVWEKKHPGVWDFRVEKKNTHKLSIYNEAEYQRWLNIFGKQEISNWKIYETSINRFFSQAGHRALARKLKIKIKDHHCVLEVGAGDGLFYKFLPINNYLAIDTNWDALAQFSLQHPEATLVCTNGGKLPITNKTVDFVISMHTLEHIYYLGEFFEDINRILNSKGRQYFVIPTEGSLFFYLGRKFVTGPNLRKKYKLDVNYVMDREHINDAKRVLKFLRLYFTRVEKNYWPFKFLRYIGCNVMIWGSCDKKD